eukprot:2488003-Amphidinium_carterae.1
MASAMYVRSMCKSATAASAVKLHARIIPCASSSPLQHQGHSSLLQHLWLSFADLVSKFKD